jgi:hypothetical protein
MATRRILSSVAIIAIALAFVGLVASFAMGKSEESGVLVATPIGTAVTSQGEMKQVTLSLNTYPDSQVPANFNTDHSAHADWISYGPSTKLQVPAHSLVTITITNYDSGGSLNNTFFRNVMGVDGTAMLNGKPFKSVSPDQVGHTFTLRPAPVNGHSELFVSVPLLAVPDDAMPDTGYTTTPNVITFSFIVGEPGEYIWNCEYPCGDGTYAKFGNAMSAERWMAGTLSVV